MNDKIRRIEEAYRKVVVEAVGMDELELILKMSGAMGDDYEMFYKVFNGPELTYIQEIDEDPYNDLSRVSSDDVKKVINAWLDKWSGKTNLKGGEFKSFGELRAFALMDENQACAEKISATFSRRCADKRHAAALADAILMNVDALATASLDSAPWWMIGVLYNFTSYLTKSDSTIDALMDKLETVSDPRLKLGLCTNVARAFTKESGDASGDALRRLAGKLDELEDAYGRKTPDSPNRALSADLRKISESKR
jgi:hypothetical protein